VGFPFSDPETAPGNGRRKKVAKLRTRFLVGTVCRRLLPEAIKELKAHWGSNDGLVPTLERLVAADSLDFHSKLPRVAKILCDPLVGFEMGCTHIVEAEVDKVLSEVLGHKKKRATLSDLCMPSSSVIC
jgi:hypothetical protein